MTATLWFLACVRIMLVWSNKMKGDSPDKHSLLLCSTIYSVSLIKLDFLTFKRKIKDSKTRQNIDILPRLEKMGLKIFPSNLHMIKHSLNVCQYEQNFRNCPTAVMQTKNHVFHPEIGRYTCCKSSQTYLMFRWFL